MLFRYADCPSSYKCACIILKPYCKGVLLGDLGQGLGRTRNHLLIETRHGST